MLFDSILLSHSKTTNAKLPVSFNLYTKRSNQNSIRFTYSEPNSLKTWKPVNCFDIQAWGPGQGRNDGGKGGRNSIMGAPHHCGGAEKSQQFHKYFLQYSKFPSERHQVRTWERQTCLLSRAPSYLVTPLAREFARFAQWLIRPWLQQLLHYDVTQWFANWG